MATTHLSIFQPSKVTNASTPQNISVLQLSKRRCSHHEEKCVECDWRAIRSFQTDTQREQFCNRGNRPSGSFHQVGFAEQVLYKRPGSMCHTDDPRVGQNVRAEHERVDVSVARHVCRWSVSVVARLSASQVPWELVGLSRSWFHNGNLVWFLARSAAWDVHLLHRLRQMHLSVRELASLPPPRRARHP